MDNVLKQRIKAILERGFAPLFLDQNYVAEFDAVYFAIFEERFCLTCRSKVIGAWQRLKNYYEMSDLTCNYRLNGNLTIFPGGTVVTNSNLTDEIAERYLATGKMRIANFSKYPADWEQRVENRVNGKVNTETTTEKADKETETNLEGMKLSELREMFPQIKARSKKEFLKELAESQA
jgi:hypothetical protein